MGKLRMATIMAGCAIMAACFCNYMPLALPAESADAAASRVIAQAVGAAINMGHPANPQWKMDSKNGCRNDLVETQAVHLSNARGSMKVTTSTGAPIHCGHPLSLANLTLQNQAEADLRKPSSADKPNLFNFDDAVIMPTIADGYGTSVHYDDHSLINQISLAENVSEHTVVGGAHVTQKNGQPFIPVAYMTVYQNVLHLIGKSQLKNLAFNDTCCTPVSGTIATQFNAGSNVSPSDQGARYVGKTETLTFDGCGSAQLRDIDGHRTHLQVSCN